jgi:hypothetical protein
MFRRSPCRTFEAIVTQTIALRDQTGSIKNIELSGSHDIARGGTFLGCEVAALIEEAAAAK